MAPLPKSPDKVRRRNKRPQVTEVRAGTSKVPIPRLPPGLGKPARDWFRGLKSSPQVELYQPSDWAMAIAAALVYDEWHKTRKIALFREFRHLSSSLLVTETDRRRAHVRIDKRPDLSSVPTEGEALVSDYKARLAPVPE